MSDANAVINCGDSEKLYMECKRQVMHTTQYGVREAEIQLKCLDNKTIDWWTKNFGDVNAVKIKTQFRDKSGKPYISTFDIAIPTERLTKLSGEVEIKCRAVNWRIEEGILQDLKFVGREKVIFT